MVDPVPALEETAGLVEVERHAEFVTLHPGEDDPAVVAESCTFPGFTAAGDTFDLIVILLQVLFDVDFLEHRLVEDLLVADRKIQEDRETPVGLILVLTSAADMNVLIPITPIRGESFVESLRALCNEVEGKVGALSHHLPDFGAPCIGIGMKEVGGKAGHHRAVLRL